MSPIHFDWSVSLGAVLITLTNIAALITVVWRVGVRFRNMERKVNFMFAWFLRQLNGKSGMTPEDIKAFFGDVPPGLR